MYFKCSLKKIHPSKRKDLRRSNTIDLKLSTIDVARKNVYHRDKSTTNKFVAHEIQKKKISRVTVQSFTFLLCQSTKNIFYHIEGANFAQSRYHGKNTGYYNDPDGLLPSIFYISFSKT